MTDPYLNLGRRQLWALMERGDPVLPEQLLRHPQGTLWQGTSLGLPSWIVRLTWRRFFKAVHPGPAGLLGFNLAAEQDEAQTAWRERQPRRAYGWFRVDYGPLIPGRTEPTTWLDYRGAGNPPLDPTGRVRDPLVWVAPETLLGYSQLCVGAVTLDTPTFFLLRPGAALDRVEPAPRASA